MGTKTKEGFYCKRCGEYLGEEGCDEDRCPHCGGDVDYHELHTCSDCGDGEYTAQLDWTCGNGCGDDDFKGGHNED